MATFSRANLRDNLARAVGFFFASTTTGGGSSTTLVDTGIQRFDTPLLGNYWVFITSGTASGESQRIASISTSTITVAVAFSATIDTAVTYEILPYDPNVMNDSLQQATRTLYPSGKRKGLWLPLTDESLVVDNLLLNNSFETFDVTFTDWDNVGTPTLSQVGNNVHLDFSARITASGATEGIVQSIVNAISETGGEKTLHVRGWLFAIVANAARLRVSFDGGTTFTNGPFHAGDRYWEGPSIQFIDVVLPASFTNVQISCVVTDGNLASFDLVTAWVDEVSHYTLPSTFYPFGPHKLLMQKNPDAPTDFIPLDRPIAGRLLRLEGMGRLTVPTTDTGTTEIDEVEAELLIAEAASHMFRTLENNPGEVGRSADHERRQAQWAVTANQLRDDIGRWGMGADERIWWSVTEESSRRLVLHR